MVFVTAVIQPFESTTKQNGVYIVLDGITQFLEEHLYYLVALGETLSEIGNAIRSGLGGLANK